MKKDIHKIADYLVNVAREGIALENKLLEWKQSEEKKVQDLDLPASKAS